MSILDNLIEYKEWLVVFIKMMPSSTLEDLCDEKDFDLNLNLAELLEKKQYVELTCGLYYTDDIYTFLHKHLIKETEIHEIETVCMQIGHLIDYDYMAAHYTTARKIT